MKNLKDEDSTEDTIEYRLKLILHTNQIHPHHTRKGWKGIQSRRNVIELRAYTTHFHFCYPSMLIIVIFCIIICVIVIPKIDGNLIISFTSHLYTSQFDYTSMYEAKDGKEKDGKKGVSFRGRKNSGNNWYWSSLSLSLSCRSVNESLTPFRNRD